MKLKKNVNINSLVERLNQLASEAHALAGSFNQAASLFNDTKLGIEQLNFNIDEEIARLNNTYTKIEELIKSL